MLYNVQLFPLSQVKSQLLLVLEYIELSFSVLKQQRIKSTVLNL